MRRLIAFFTLTLYFTGSALAGIVTGNVTGILDGDTFEFLHHRHPERLRLSGIDRPEKGQAYGKKASSSRPRSPTARKSRSKSSVRTDTDAPWAMWC